MRCHKRPPGRIIRRIIQSIRKHFLTRRWRGRRWRGRVEHRRPGVRVYPPIGETTTGVRCGKRLRESIEYRFNMRFGFRKSIEVLILRDTIFGGCSYNRKEWFHGLKLILDVDSTSVEIIATGVY